MEDFPACGPLSFLPMPKGQGYPERTFDETESIREVKGFRTFV
jgi:hypothetical protein